MPAKEGQFQVHPGWEKPMNKLKRILALLVVLGIGSGLVSCDGRAERAGEKIDRTLEKAGDKIEGATDRR